MVAVIKVSSSILRILNYNENKVRENKAACLLAGNYPADAVDLTFNMKLNFFLRQMELNKNVSRNSLHISLNFDPSEKQMNDEKMAAIAREYLFEIGFGEQPYLVYRHFDAGHSHLHIITTNIKSDGSRIDLHHLAIRKSEPARKKIEEAYGLIKAQGKKQLQENKAVGRAVYGKSETRSSIQNVLEAVLEKYRYTSLSELNAVLGLYNVSAERGSAESRVYRHGGLLYRTLDENAKPVGVPIKASLFHNAPTLARLEVKFGRNKITGQQHKARIKNAINQLAGAREKPGFSDMEALLSKVGISIVKRISEDGRIYGLTYVDHRTGAVFNGSALGKSYSAKEMQERFTGSVPRLYEPDAKQRVASNERLRALSDNLGKGNPQAGALINGIATVLQNLTSAAYAADYLPKQFSRKKKRRKRGTSENN